MGVRTWVCNLSVFKTTGLEITLLILQRNSMNFNLKYCQSQRKAISIVFKISGHNRKILLFGRQLNSASHLFHYLINVALYFFSSWINSTHSSNHFPLTSHTMPCVSKLTIQDIIRNKLSCLCTKIGQVSE